jgi:hypothetical protein
MEIKLKNALVPLLLIIFFFFSLYLNQYFFDYSHTGYLIVNANNFLTKKIYTDYVNYYGILNDVINSFILANNNNNFYSIIIFYNFIYYLSIYNIYLISRKILDQKISFIIVFLFLAIHPFISHPTHNYLNFLIVTTYLLIIYNYKKITIGLCGILLSLIFFINQSSFIFVLTILSTTIFFFIKEIKNNLLHLFCFALSSVIIIYLIPNKSEWIYTLKFNSEYLKLSNLTVIDFIKNYLYSLIKISFIKLFQSPSYLFFLFLIIFNILFSIKLIINKFTKKNKNLDNYFLILSLASLSSLTLSFHDLTTFRFVTGLMISAPLPFYYYKKNLSNINILYFVIFLIFFLPLDRYNNNQEYPLKSEREDSSNLKLIPELKSFKFQKYEKENITFLNETLKKIKINCNNKEMYGINLTSNNLYFYFLDKYLKTTQKISFFEIKNKSFSKKRDENINKYFDPKLSHKMESLIYDKQAIIISGNTFFHSKFYIFEKEIFFNNEYDYIEFPKRSYNDEKSFYSTENMILILPKVCKDKLYNL